MRTLLTSAIAVLIIGGLSPPAKAYAPSMDDACMFLIDDGWPLIEEIAVALNPSPAELYPSFIDTPIEIGETARRQMKEVSLMASNKPAAFMFNNGRPASTADLTTTKGTVIWLEESPRG